MNRFLKTALCLLLALLCAGLSAVAGATAYYSRRGDAAWYEQVLQDGVMNAGNNLRLKEVVRRAGEGESITVATIGGSITEGAGATTYAGCYASRFVREFARLYGADEGKNIQLVNAGVGGTGSPFGLMRYDRDVTARVTDEDGLADLVVIEFSVNDYQEPTRHRAFESLVKKVLEQPNRPAVILLFAVFKNGFNLQTDLRKIGDAYDLMMISVKDAVYPHIGKEWTSEEFFSDEYHPTSLGHGVMADCLLAGVRTALAAEDSAEDISPDIKPVYGTDYTELRTVYGDSEGGDYTLIRGGFAQDDASSYKNLPVGRVCGKNFAHTPADSDEPLVFKATFSKLLIAWRSVAGSTYGEAEVLVDGKSMKKLKGNSGSWGQSEVALVWDLRKSGEHTVEIRMTEGNEKKRFTVTAIGYAP